MNEQPHARPLLQMGQTGRPLKVFYSVSEAARMTGISRTAITNALSKKSGLHYSGGFLWKYISDLP